tara:strand:- start:1120 stop:1455 length:336 start_codon:yes stop_codon:yes gene_type:complete
MENQEELYIDLNVIKSGKINELSYLTHLGSKIELMIKLMFGSQGLSRLAGRVSGTKKQVNKFLDALKGEKRYANAYIKHGLADQRTLNSRYKLEKAISAFEKETGIKWPIK